MSVFIAALAFYDAEGHPGHMASFEDRMLPGPDGSDRPWRVVSSRAISFSLNQGENEKDNTPPDTLSALEPLIRKLALEESKVHWIKVYLSPSGAVTIDCALDNEKSEEVNSLFTNFQWPRDSDTKFLRQFHILKPNVGFEPATGTTSIPLLSKS